MRLQRHPSSQASRRRHRTRTRLRSVHPVNARSAGEITFTSSDDDLRVTSILQNGMHESSKICSRTDSMRVSRVINPAATVVACGRVAVATTVPAGTTHGRTKAWWAETAWSSWKKQAATSGVTARRLATPARHHTQRAVPCFRDCASSSSSLLPTRTETHELQQLRRRGRGGRRAQGHRDGGGGRPVPDAPVQQRSLGDNRLPGPDVPPGHHAPPAPGDLLDCRGAAPPRAGAGGPGLHLVESERATNSPNSPVTWGCRQQCYRCRRGWDIHMYGHMHPTGVFCSA